LNNSVHSTAVPEQVVCVRSSLKAYTFVLPVLRLNSQCGSLPSDVRPCAQATSHLRTATAQGRLPCHKSRDIGGGTFTDQNEISLGKSIHASVPPSSLRLFPSLLFLCSLPPLQLTFPLHTPRYTRDPSSPSRTPIQLSSAHGATPSQRAFAPAPNALHAVLLPPSSLGGTSKGAYRSIAERPAVS
jgi:hypothetical protein